MLLQLGLGAQQTQRLLLTQTIDETLVFVELVVLVFDHRAVYIVRLFVQALVSELIRGRSVVVLAQVVLLRHVGVLLLLVKQLTLLSADWSLIIFEKSGLRCVLLI